MRPHRQLSILAISFLTGIAVQAQAKPSSTEQDKAKKLTRLSDSTLPHYVFTRRDYRRCVYPLCGGFFVQQLGQRSTPCADGQWRSECQVVEVDYRALDLSPKELERFRQSFESGNGIIQGRLFQHEHPDFDFPLKVLRVNRAWIDTQE